MIAVGFSLDGTLARDGGAERAAFFELAGRIAAERSRPLDEVRAAAAFERMHAEVHAGRAPVERAANLALADAVGDDLGRDYGIAYRVLAGATAAQTTSALPGATGLLARFSELAIPTAVLANGWYGLERQKARAIGFAGPVLVPPVDDWKPAQSAFDALVRLFGLTPERVWYVGTDPRTDVAGALAAGLQAVWLNPSDERFPSDLPAPAQTIRRLDELLEVISGPYTRAALSLRQLLISQY
ncbi:MAG: HAD family hydrolase [Vulcanimicrobiaceae bacterium]